jgi:peptidoglycan/LPS O-acetylase OafA/YrhL
MAVRPPKCPFCAEPVKRGASVCRHCGRDFGLLQPLLARIEALEGRLGEPRTEAPADPETRVPSRLARSLLGFGVLIGVMWTSGAYLASFPPRVVADLRILPALVLPPVCLGALVGALARRPWPTLLAAGQVMGLLNLGVVCWILPLSGIGIVWPWTLLIFVVGQPAIFATAAQIAGQVADRPPGRGWLTELFKSASFRIGVVAQLLAQIATIVSFFRLFSSKGG